MKALGILVACLSGWFLLSCPAVRETFQQQTPADIKQENPQSSKTAATLSNDVREIIRPRCGSCHTSTLSTAKPGAIKIFDLAREQWAATMSAHQLDKFQSRLTSLADNERGTIAEFIKQEKAKRGT